MVKGRRERGGNSATVYGKRERKKIIREKIIIKESKRTKERIERRTGDTLR